MEIEEKIGLLEDTVRLMGILSNKITNAGVQSSFTEGTYHHEIAYDLDIPSTFASAYITHLWAAVNDPEAKKEYNGWLHPIKKRRAKAARQRAAKILSRMPETALQEINMKAAGAIACDIEAGIAHYARMLSTRRGQEISVEDFKIMRPLRYAADILGAYAEIHRAVGDGIK